ncbi:MAG: cytochrome c biogenesis protein CcdA [Pyrinomonadaceae bacterium]
MQKQKSLNTSKIGQRNLNRSRRLATRFLLPLLILLSAGTAVSQNPVNWKLETGTVESGEAIRRIVHTKAVATIDDGWKLYSLNQKSGGPIATTFSTAKGSGFELKGTPSESIPKTKFDPNFKLDTSYFEHKAEFTIDLVSNADVASDTAKVDVKYQVCNDSLCLPPKTVRVGINGSELVKGGKVVRESSPKPEPLIEMGRKEGESIWSFVWLAITLGALSLLTPCVFPMIPITVSYFTKNAGENNAKSMRLAFVYSAGIIATFTILGMLLAIFVGAAGLNIFAANPWVNIAIAGVFLFFAFNLFGFYEIVIPSSILSKLDALARTKEGEGSAYIGALLMGLTFTVTSFTCTSPFVGTILVSTAQGDWKLPLVGMLAFSTVFALPFFVLALAPQLLSRLPKSGGWMSSVKVVMGFLEIAAALKFLSNVDLVWTSKFSTDGTVNYGTILFREAVLGVWVVIALLISAYILGLFRFRHEFAKPKIGIARAGFSFVFLLLAVYLGTGFLGLKLGELESFLPPKNVASKLNVLGNREAELEWLKNDLQTAIDRARIENKRVFVDFTGYTCTNCRWMEANMFTQPEVKREMEKYVLVSLYTDGDGEIYTRQQAYQEENFKTVALPFYAILDAGGNPVRTFPGLTRDKSEFLEFLK